MMQSWAAVVLVVTLLSLATAETSPPSPSPSSSVNCSAVTALLPTNVSVSTVPVDVGASAATLWPAAFSASLRNMTDAVAACFALSWRAPASTTPNATTAGLNVSFTFNSSTPPTAWVAFLTITNVATQQAIYTANVSAITYAIRRNATFVYMDDLAKNWTVVGCSSETFVVMKWSGPGANTLENILALRGLRIVGRLPAHMVNNHTLNCSLIVGTVEGVVATGLGAEVTLSALNYTDIFDHLVIDVPDLHSNAASQQQQQGQGALRMVPQSSRKAKLRQVITADDNLASPRRLGMERSLDCDLSVGAGAGLSGDAHCNYNIVDGGLTITVGAGLGLNVRFPFHYVIGDGALQSASAGVVGTITGTANVGASLSGNVVVDLTETLFDHKFYCEHFGIDLPCFFMVGPIPIVFVPYIKGSVSNKFSFIDKASITYTRSASLTGSIAVEYVRGVGPGFVHDTSYVPGPPDLDVSASCSMNLGATIELEAGVKVQYAIEAGASVGIGDELTYTQPSKECVGATQGKLEDAIKLDIKGIGKVFDWDVTVPLWSHDFDAHHTCMAGLPSAVCGPAAFYCRQPEYECFMGSSGTSSNRTACADSCTMPKTQCTVCGQSGANSCCNCPQYSGPCSSGCAIFCPCPSSEFNVCCMPFGGGGVSNASMGVKERQRRLRRPRN